MASPHPIPPPSDDLGKPADPATWQFTKPNLRIYKTFEAIVKTYMIKLQNHDKKLIRKEVQLRPRQNEIQYLSTVKAKLITFQA